MTERQGNALVSNTTSIGFILLAQLVLLALILWRVW